MLCRPHNCTFCGKNFAKPEHAFVHEKKNCHLNPESKNFHSLNERPYSCSVCGLSYTNRFKLRYHEKNECQKIQKCIYCGNTFLYCSSLYKHQAGRCPAMSNKKNL